MAEKNYLVHLNLNKNQLLNAAMQVVGTVPSTPSQGQFYFNTSDNNAYVNDGTNWLNLTTKEGTISLLNGGLDLTSRSWSSKELKDWIKTNPGGYTTLAGYGILDAYTKTEVDNKLVSVYKSKGSVANFAALPSSGQSAGDVWNLLDTGDNYVWVLDYNNTGTPGWDKLSGIVDVSGYVPTSRKLTINGTQFDLSADRSWTIPAGTVTSVGLSVPTGLTVSNSPITNSGTIGISLSAGYIIPTQSQIDGKNVSLVTSTTSSGASDVVTTNTNTFLNIIQGGVAQGVSRQLTGTGSVTVSADINGKITIAGVDTNTTYTNGTGLSLTGTTFAAIFGTAAGTVAQGNDSRFHNAVTLGTPNGLSLSTQILSLALATTSSAGAMSASDKTKLDGLGGVDRFTQLFGSTSSTSYNIDHNLNSKFLIVQIYEESSGKIVEMEVIVSTVNRVIINLNNIPDITNKYRVVIMK